jgi:hypothetical protein
MTSKWDKYYPLLSDAHKAKYKIIQNDCEITGTRNSELCDRLTELHKEVIQLDEYKNVIDKMPNDTLAQSRIRYKAVEDLKLKHFPNYTALCQSREIARMEFISNDHRLTDFRHAVYILYELPRPKATPTDDESKQCSICTVNLKDHALLCGHIYCIDCIDKMKCECPTCKKKFVKSKVIKLFQ